MIGFLLDVDPELPEEISDGLPEKGHTLAYAVFPPWQRIPVPELSLGQSIHHINDSPGNGVRYCLEDLELYQNRILFHLYALSLFLAARKVQGYR